MSEPLLAIRALQKTYASGPRRIRVLQGLDLTVEAGEAVAVVGDSGVGKSTLLHIVGGLDRPDAGAVHFRDQDVFAWGTADLARYRNRSVGLVFQFHHLLPEFTAIENVAMPFRIGRIRGDSLTRCRQILDRLGLADRLDHYPSALSGGEQQRVAIARALAPGPALVLADEPTGNLDPSTGGRVFGLLRDQQRQEGFALVLATHSGRLAQMCDRILRLEGGVLVPLDEAEAGEYFAGTAQPPGTDPS